MIGSLLYLVSSLFPPELPRALHLCSACMCPQSNRDRSHTGAMEADCGSYDGIIQTHAGTLFSCLMFRTARLLFILIVSRGGSCLCSSTPPIRDSPQAVWKKMPGQSDTLSPWASKCSAPSPSPKTSASTVSDALSCSVSLFVLWQKPPFLLKFPSHYTLTNFI